MSGINLDELPDQIDLSQLPDQKEPKKEKSYLDMAEEGLRNTWTKLNEPITTLPSRVASKISEPLMQYGESGNNLNRKAALYSGAFIQSLGDVVSSLSSPVNLGLAVGTEGTSLAASKGLGTTAKVLNKGTKALSVPVAVEGAHNIYSGENVPEKLMGAAELAGGLYGIKSRVPEIRPSLKPLDIDLKGRTNPEINPRVDELQVPDEIPNLLRKKPKVKLNADGTYTDLNSGKIIDKSGKEIKPEVPLAENINPAVAPVQDPLFNSHGGPDQFNGKSYDMKHAGGDPQFAASQSRARAMQDWAKKQELIKQGADKPTATSYIKALKEGTIEKGTSFGDFVKRFTTEESGTFDPEEFKKGIGSFLEHISSSFKDNIKTEENVGTKFRPKSIDLMFPDKESKEIYDFGKLGLLSPENSKEYGILNQELASRFNIDGVEAGRLIYKYGSDIRKAARNLGNETLHNPPNFYDWVSNFIKDESGSLDISKLKGRFDEKMNQRTYDRTYQKVLNTLASGGRLDFEALRSSSGLKAKDFDKFIDRIVASGQIENDIKKLELVNQSKSPAEKLLNILEVNKVNRVEQDALRSAETGKRFAAFDSSFKGTKDSFALGASKMKGEYEKVVSPVEFQLGGKDTDTLFAQIKDANITIPEQLRAGVALRDLLEGQRTLAPNEIQLMDRIFGNGFGTKIIEMHGGIGAPMLKIAKTANTMKSMKATLDLSAPFRQGLGLVGRRQFWRAFKEMGKYATSHEAYLAGQRAIEEHPNFLFNREAGLYTADHTLGNFEEQFADSYLNDLHNLMGDKAKYSPAQISERAYTGFLNKLRFDTMNALIEKAQKAGRETFDIVKMEGPDGSIVEYKQPNDLAKQIANYVNNATGRGSLGKLEKSGDVLNAALFSPRLISSRLTTLNPIYYIKADPFVRKEALRTLFELGAFTAIAGGVGEMLGGEVLRGSPFGKNATNSDYMKLKIGNTRIDPSGGFLPYIVLVSRFFNNQKISSQSGKTQELGKGITPTWLSSAAGFGNKYNPSFVENRLSPMAALIDTLLTQRNTEDPKKTMRPTEEVRRAFTPLITQDIMDLYKEDPSSVPLALLGGLGMGVQTYGD